MYSSPFVDLESSTSWVVSVMLVYLLNMCLSWRGRHLPGDDSFAGGEHHEEHLFGGIRVPSPYFNLQSRHLIHFFLMQCFVRRMILLFVVFFDTMAKTGRRKFLSHETVNQLPILMFASFVCTSSSCVNIYISLFGLSSASSLKERTVFFD